MLGVRITTPEDILRHDLNLQSLWAKRLLRMPRIKNSVAETKCIEKLHRRALLYSLHLAIAEGRDTHAENLLAQLRR